MGFKVPKRGKKSKKWDFLIFKGLAIFKGLEKSQCECSGGLGMQHTISYPYALSRKPLGLTILRRGAPEKLFGPLKNREQVRQICV